MAYIREYYVTQGTLSGKIVGSVKYRDDEPTRTRLSPIPTLEEVRGVLGEQIEGLSFKVCFNPNNYVKAFPKIPPSETVLNIESMFSYCTAMEVAPALPSVDSYDGVLNGCRNLLIPAIIPKTARNIYDMYSECTSLKSPPSIPAGITEMRYAFKECVNMTGEMIIRLSSFPSGYKGDYFFKDTEKEIILYGDRAVCEAAAAKANNHNAHWSAWYDPVPAVTDRGQGSYTTAEDITRMVRNGALAVSSYAPGRMVYHQGDIVREDEWIALVEAAQTIDPTVTASTNYANLNKIEAAFDSAL